MKIYRFDPKGIHLAEITGIGEIEKDLPKDWFGFSNFVMRLPRSRESREIDVAIVTHDRIILVDLKDWRGYIENRDNYWFQNGEQRDRSAALKINENAQKLKELLKLAPKIPAIPRVEGLVVFTHQEGNFSGLSDVDKQRCLSLSKFLKLADEKRYDDFFKPYYQYSRKNPLNEKETRSIILNFFKENRYFEPRESKFAGYRLIGSSTFQHPKEIYDEYFCEFENDKNHTALLRIWDFSKLSAEFSAEDIRRSIANREYTVHGYIKVQCPELYRDGILNSKDSDRSFSMRFWQLFEVGRDLKRINSYVNIHSESLTLQRRLELTSLFLARIAELHRIKTAHRDLDGDSVWIEPSSRIILSRFSAAYYPEHATIGDKRVKLLAAGTRLPEDAELVNPGTAFQQDVFLAAVVCWKILTGEDELPGDENIPIWQSGNMRANLELPDDLEPWFDRCLTHEPSKRFSDCIEAFDAYRKVASHHEPVDFSSCLTRHTRDDIDLFLDYPITKLIQKGPPRIYVSGEGDTAVLVKQWPDFFLGIRRQSAASLYTFLSITEEIQAHLTPWIPEIITACLCTDGLILVQKYIDVSNLKDTNLAFWDTEIAIYFISHLLQAVEYLHENKITHGDLKPDNILVVNQDKYPKPILVDFPDFSPPAAGQRMTLAYCPELGSEDPEKRDRFAVYKISVEIFERIGGSGKDNLAQRLLKEAMVQLKDGTASMTLLPLRAILEQSHRTTTPSIEINIGFPQCHENADLLADNGIFYARIEINERKIYIVGMDQKIQIILPSDPKSGEITAARIWPASTEDVAYANRQGVAFRGRVSVYKNRKPKIQGLQELINIPEIAQFFSKPIPPEIVDLKEKDKLIDKNETASININSVRFEGFKVERFWREVIDAEADLLPEILVIDKVSHDNQVLIVSCEEQETAELDFEGDKNIDVIREGKKIGELDTSLSASGLIALRNVKHPLLITPGTRLRFQEHGNLNSFRCRSKAVDRILRCASEIRELIEYFNPSANINPRQWSRSPSEEIIARYDLNDQQKQAFRHLWTYGPVGLLQGPPGTGKTKFISSFIHYALNEGGMRNVLLLSQSHEAVNNAAEKVLERAHEFGNPIDLLRIGQQGKVSKPLLPYHSDLVQERYRELFRAEMKGRIAIVGKQLGLPAAYIAEAFELEATIGQLVHQIINRESDLKLSSEHDLDLESTKRKLRTLHEIYESYLNDLNLGFDLEPSEVMNILRRRLRQQYNIHDISATEKLRHCYKIAEESHRAASSITTKSKDVFSI